MRNVTEDRRTISTRCSTRLENSLPVDLIIEILLRLPAKSVATCRCVSKLWGSVIRLQYFTELFLTRSLHRPQLLFYCSKDGKIFFFSSPQLQNNPTDENSSATSLMHFPSPSDFSVPVHGLICLAQDLYFKRMELETEILICNPEIVICNPGTGQSLILPKLNVRSKATIKLFGLTCFLAYEPIKKQFKVLLSYGGAEHQVLTLGTGVVLLSWRRIECSTPHFPREKCHICINGVLYYTTIRFSSDDYIIVCFDVSSEKFRFITVSEAAHVGTLTNYNGKLASLVYELPSIELWVLENVEKQVWSKHTYVVPAWFHDIFETVDLFFIGVTRTNEIMFAQCYITLPFYVFYFSIEKKTVRRVAIHGMEAFQDHPVLTFLDHVENVTLF